MAPTQSFTSSITLIVRQATSSTSIPQAPAAAGFAGSSRSDGFSPVAIIGIVTAIVGILVLVPLIAIILRRQQEKRCRELLLDSASGGLKSSTSSVREEQGLKSILVTREVQRSSLKVDPGLRRPEEAYTHQKGWSNTEVHGGHWK